MDNNMGARKEDKKEPQPGNPESSEQQDMDAEDDELGDEDEFDLQGKEYILGREPFPGPNKLKHPMVYCRDCCAE